MTLRFEVEPEAAAHRVEPWCGEPLLHEGEDPAVALAPGTARRAALDAALAEMAAGRTEPSYAWRRDFALILGLDRVLSDPQPKLASGTTLRRHQVDALAGQLAALLGPPEPPAAPKAAAGTVEVRGRVLGPDGKPVAGARVFLAPCARWARTSSPPRQSRSRRRAS
jgi:hypothetical protein